MYEKKQEVRFKYVCVSLALYTCLTIWGNTSYSAPTCKEMYQKETIARPPIGLSRGQLHRLVHLLATNPEFNSAEVVVLFGSRTNFNSGHKPRSDSDLDILVFEQPDNRIGSNSERYNEILKEFSKEVGFSVNHIPIYESTPFAQHLTERRGLIGQVSQSVEQSRWLEIQNSDRSKYAKLVWNAPGAYPRFKSGTFFLIRPSSNATMYFQTLRNLGYENIIVLN